MANEIKKLTETGTGTLRKNANLLPTAKTDPLTPSSILFTPTELLTKGTEVMTEYLKADASATASIEKSVATENTKRLQAYTDDDTRLEAHESINKYEIQKFKIHKQSKTICILGILGIIVGGACYITKIATTKTIA